MKKYVVLFLLIGIINAQLDSNEIAVDREGLINTLFQKDSIQLELDAQIKLIKLFENDTTKAKSLIRAQKTHIKTLKTQRFKYKKNWIKSERAYRSEKNKKYWWSGIVTVLILLLT